MCTRFLEHTEHSSIDGPRARFGPLLVLSLLSVVSHAGLDWLNSYGVRLLMPFEGRWFYGDSLFIIDPWLWLAGLTPCLLVHSERGRSLALWGLLTAAMTAIILLTDAVGWGVKVAWMTGLVAIWTVRCARGVLRRAEGPGRIATAVFLELNGVPASAADNDDVYRLVMAVASDRPSLDQIVVRLRAILG